MAKNQNKMNAEQITRESKEYHILFLGSAIGSIILSHGAG